MNKKGHPDTLVAAHPGNLNALRSGAHSPRLLDAVAAVQELEIADGVVVAIRSILNPDKLARLSMR